MGEKDKAAGRLFQWVDTTLTRRERIALKGGAEPLTSREIRMLENVLLEVKDAITLSEATRMLEKKNENQHQDVGLQLANPDMKLIAFALRPLGLKAVGVSIAREFYQWMKFALVTLPLLLAKLVLAYARVIPGEELREVIFSFNSLAGESKRSRQNAIKELSRDGRAPILFLRSFSFDLERASSDEDFRTVEERIAFYYQKYGPTLTVGNPKDETSLLGPLRLYFEGDIWRAGVLYLMSISQLVIIQIGNSHGTVWELGVAWSRLPPERVLISLADPANPDAPDASTWKYFQRYLEEVIGWETISVKEPPLYIGFGADWEPRFYYSKGKTLPGAVSKKTQFATTVRGEWSVSGSSYSQSAITPD